MKLVIVESPTKARTIQRYLGNGFRVVASNGHIRDLSFKGKGGLGVDVENNFDPDYTLYDHSKNRISYINKLKEDAEEVYLATDPDREGEAIAWHLAEELQLDIKTTKRLIFNEITKKSINEAMENPRYLDTNLIQSQETRRILDRIIGFKLSNLLQKKINTRSAGRVQSVALKLIVEKEKEINTFKEEVTYGVQGKIQNETINVELVDEKKKPVRLQSKQSLGKLLEYEGGDFLLKTFEENITKRYPAPPFTTSSLQQDAFSKFRFSASKTNRIAQKLYEGIQLGKETAGLITYMRTDSIRLSTGFIFASREYIKENYNEDYLGFVKTQKADSKVQDAHEAIRPTFVQRDPESIKEFLKPDEYKLYKLIWTRAVASMMKHAEIKTQDALFSKDEYFFLAKGRQLMFDGYKKIYADYENEKFEDLNDLVEGEQYKIEKLVIKTHKTKPPYRYSEGSLIKEMEKLGIGRPSTYASTIETLKKSSYIQTVKSYLHPSESGMLADEKLFEYFKNIINVDYTANMENQLDKIAEGELDKLTALNEFYNPFIEQLEVATKEMKPLGLDYTGEPCPECGKRLVKYNGRYGEYIGCEDRKDCKYIKREKPEVIDITCPLCKKGKLVVRQSKFGKKEKFYGCSTYPNCKYTQNIEK